MAPLPEAAAAPVAPEGPREAWPPAAPRSGTPPRALPTFPPLHPVERTALSTPLAPARPARASSHPAPSPQRSAAGLQASDGPAVHGPVFAAAAGRALPPPAGEPQIDLEALRRDLERSLRDQIRTDFERGA